MVTLTQEELRERARRITLVLADCDGVLTDTGVYYGENGEAMKRFSIRDGMGVELLRNAGIDSAIVTRENTEIVHTRSEKLRMPYLFMGVFDKALYLHEILQKTGRTLDQIAYIGDDVNDLGIIRAIAMAGLVGSPQDALKAVRAEVHYCTAEVGGHGAFREFADWILELRS
jgi:3-deoxy-D-manno-octulosonate 8-phosphate phosphatase (KDO 8-P phosphatase)